MAKSLAKPLTYVIYAMHFVFLGYVLFYQGAERHAKAEADHIRAVVAQHKQATGDNYVSPALVMEAEADFRAQSTVDVVMFENAKNNSLIASASMLVAALFLWQRMYILALTLLIPAAFVTANYFSATGELSGSVVFPSSLALAAVAVAVLGVRRISGASGNG